MPWHQWYYSNASSDGSNSNDAIYWHHSNNGSAINTGSDYNSIMTDNMITTLPVMLTLPKMLRHQCLGIGYDSNNFLITDFLCKVTSKSDKWLLIDSHLFWPITSFFCINCWFTPCNCISIEKRLLIVSLPSTSAVQKDSPVSPVKANIYMEYSKDCALGPEHLNPWPQWKKYVGGSSV